MSGKISYLNWQQERELELLNSNMESIANELGGMLLSNEIQCAPTDAVAGGLPSACYNYECTNPNFSYQTYAQSNQGPQQLNAMAQNLTYPSNAPLQNVLEKGSLAVERFNDYTSSTSMVPVGGAIAAAAVGYTPSPKFEFHYLRSESFNQSATNANPIPLISTANKYANELRANDSRHGYAGVGGSAFRRNHHHKNKKAENVYEEIDYDKVVVNLAELGISNDSKERNPVLRLFGLFRQLNYYLHDVFPFGLTVCGMPTEAKPIPYTMNVQYQVKNAARNCTIFICSKERILNANKLYDLELYDECEKSLNVMRKLCSQLETFKRIELEHKRCQFVTEEAKVKAQRLELLIEQLNDQVRECNLLVHVFDWTIEMKFKSQSEHLVKAQAQCLVQSQNNGQGNGDESCYQFTPRPVHNSEFPSRFIGEN